MQTPTCGELPFDRLRANGIRAHVPGFANASVHPSTGSGRTGNEHDASVYPLTRSGRTRALVPGSADASVHPSTGSGRTGNEHMYRGSADASVYPSTCLRAHPSATPFGSGRTGYEHMRRVPQMPLFTLRHAQGERETSTCTGLRRRHSSPFDRLRANGRVNTPAAK